MSSHAPRFTYQLEISRSSDGHRYGLRQIPDSQLSYVREQLMFLAQRRGLVPADPTGIETCEQPQFENAMSGELAALLLSIGEGAKRIEQRFGLDLFQPFAESITAELVQTKQLEAGEDIVCRTFAQPQATSDAPGGIVARVQREPLPLLPGNLASLLPLAKRVGVQHPGDHPVFVLEEALERAQELSWKGRSLEGGAWLIGGLYQQTEPEPEIYGVVHTVLEARGATHEQFSIDMSTETFVDLQAQLERRKKRFGRVGEIVQGVFHTHPFLPSILDGKEACPSCPLRPECNLTSSFFSQTDAQFHKALFGRAPYAIEMVLGLTPREEYDLRMFVMDGNAFRQRGYYRLAKLP